MFYLGFLVGSITCLQPLGCEAQACVSFFPFNGLFVVIEKKKKRIVIGLSSGRDLRRMTPLLQSKEKARECPKILLKGSINKVSLWQAEIIKERAYIFWHRITLFIGMYLLFFRISRLFFPSSPNKKTPLLEKSNDVNQGLETSSFRVLLHLVLKPNALS